MKEKYKKFFKIKSILLDEAVIFTDAYLEEIFDKINNIKKQFLYKKSLSSICYRLNLLFLFDKIKFIEEKNIVQGKDEYIKFGINSGACIADKYGSIRIFLNSNILNSYNNEEFYKLFIKHLTTILKHELVHRGQALKIEDLEKRSKVLTKDYGELTTKNNIKKYLADKQEIMSNAWFIIQTFKFYNYDNNKILKTLNVDHNYDDKKIIMSNLLRIYHEYFRMNENPIKLLYKYMFMYLQKEEKY
jgi:hypothetical protein